MAFSPTTTVYLLDTPLDNKYKNQILFTSSTYQWDYFRAQTKHDYHNCTYQRKNNSIRVHENIENLWDSNYVMYQNANFGTKWFYAFIIKMEYISEEVTEIFIETDVFQTWRSETALMRSFVVREHVDDDTIGLHLIDEQLEYGDYKMQAYHPVGKMGESWNILATSDNAPLGISETVGNIYGNIVTGLTYFPFPNTYEGLTWLKGIINTYASEGKPEAIMMIFTVPELIIKDAISQEDWEIGFPLTTQMLLGQEIFRTSKQIIEHDGYIPKNNKLHTYPYKFLYISNNSGQSATYKYEDFTNDLMEFAVFGIIMPNPQVMLAPMSYKGEGADVKYEYGLSLSGFPMGSWTSDQYTAWFAQNATSIGVGLGGSALAILGGAVAGSPLVVAGGVLGVFSQMAQIQKASIQPDQAKGQLGSGSLQYGIDNLDFYYAHMIIKSQYAKMVDDFLTMYGYKVNALKVPETRSRLYWNYIKTIDVNIDGAIPDEDMERLKAIYNDGVTLWHDPTYFLRYDLNNAIGDFALDVPTLTSAITNSDGTVITLTFNKAMANPIGKQAQFTLNVAGVDRVISSITLNATTTKIDLTISTPITGDQVVKLAYTRGNIIAVDKSVLANFSNYTVVNNTPHLPTLTLAETNTLGTIIILTFSKAMDDPTGRQNEFIVKVAGITRSVNSCALDANTNKINLTLASSITFGQAVIVSYVKGAVKANDGALLENFTNMTVTNKLPDPGYQIWANYPPSPMLTTAKKYQCIANRGGTITLFATNFYNMYVVNSNTQLEVNTGYSMYNLVSGNWVLLYADANNFNFTSLLEANQPIYTSPSYTVVYFAKTTP